MALKKVNENPHITDTILLEIETPGVDGCFTSNPYKVDKVTIYYVERNFLGTNYGEYTNIIVSSNLQKQLVEAEKAVCEDDSLYNLQKLQEIKDEIISSQQENVSYYKDRTAIKVIGTPGNPAWLSSDTENSMLKLVSEDEEGNAQYGHFTYEWNPMGSIREGDYFVCWTWTPLLAGDKLSAHIHFSITGDGGVLSTLPTHETPRGKYDTLLERYLPEMYKYNLTQNDLTPVVTDKLNKSVARGFTFLEDMANQIIDLFDANALHESMLSYLSNNFALKLKSNDPTLWRRQIKEAIPLFKKKGTLEGLKEAFAQAGMTLDGFTQFWQVVSPNTWTESFKVVDSDTFILDKDHINTPDNTNFGLWLTRGNTTTELSSDYVSITTLYDGRLQMAWIGDTLPSNAVNLFVNDIIKIRYEYNPETYGNYDSSLENYFQNLPLMDQRNEASQMYPPKNWNVRLISEDDPFFDTLVSVRNPFYDPLVFGHVRTEFAYSENIYNADEYNGSIRPSLNPCHIDKKFIDPCGACLSSSYHVDVGIQELCNDRILEAQNILKEYTPFHSRLHSINFTGEVNEFIQSPTEQIETLITMDHVQFILSGQVNPFFNRNMLKGLTDWKVTREDLANQLTVLSGKLGTAYNNNVAFISPDRSLKDLGINQHSNVLEILSPSVNAGTYTIDNINGSMANLSSNVSEPLNQTAFTFNLSNIKYHNYVTSIIQDNLVTLNDLNYNLQNEGIKTQWDVENTPDYSGGAWKIRISAYSTNPYEIADIKNGVIILDGDSNLPTTNTSSVNYTLLNDINEVIHTSTSGNLTIENRGYVQLNDSHIEVEEHVKVGFYLYYNNDEYLITAFDGTNLWIKDYTEGDAVGVFVQIRQRLLENEIGYFNYQGLRLKTFADHESEFEIVNGSNPPTIIKDDSNFKENYMFMINDEYYKIIAIDEDEVVLAGRDQNWKTWAAGGTAVAYSIVHFPKKEVNVGFTVFDHLDRDGQDPVVREVYSDIDQETVLVALSMPKDSGIQENVTQNEGVSVIIEMRNGETLEGDL